LSGGLSGTGYTSVAGDTASNLNFGMVFGRIIRPGFYDQGNFIVINFAIVYSVRELLEEFFSVSEARFLTNASRSIINNLSIIGKYALLVSPIYFLCLFFLFCFPDRRTLFLPYV